MIQTKNKIEIDTFEVGIYHIHYELSADTECYGNRLGLIHRVNPDNLYLKVSSKLFASAEDIGSINSDNFVLIPDIISDLTGIKLDKEHFLTSADLFSVHTKKDLIVDTEPVTGYISLFREIFKRASDKFDVYKYSDLTYQNGLQILPKPNTPSYTGVSLHPKTIDNYRYIIYLKGAELNKYDNKDFKKLFSYEYLEFLYKMIRFELQLRTFEDIREHYKVEEPTLAEILNSEENPVYNFFMKLLHEAEEE